MHIVVFTTLESADEARALVRRLVEDRIVACGTVVDRATSVYRWRGAIEEASEVQVILKTRHDRWNDLERAVQNLHPYDVPELLAMPVERGLPAYLEWVTAETGTSGEASA